MNVRPFQSDKAVLRDQIRAALASLSADFWKDASEQACARLANSDFAKEARTILVFCPMKAEVDIVPFALQAMQRGVTVCAPRVVPAEHEGEKPHIEALRIASWENDLERGPFGALQPKPFCEPIPLRKLDLILVPGLAFDASGGRLGRGGGFYDRLLQVSGAKTVGVCLDEQIVPKVPSDELDERVEIVVSPTRTLRV